MVIKYEQLNFYNGATFKTHEVHEEDARRGEFVFRTYHHHKNSVNYILIKMI